jgi:hypothetical protein
MTRLLYGESERDHIFLISNIQNITIRKVRFIARPSYSYKLNNSFKLKPESFPSFRLFIKQNPF